MREGLNRRPRPVVSNREKQQTTWLSQLPDKTRSPPEVPGKLPAQDTTLAFDQVLPTPLADALASHRRSLRFLYSYKPFLAFVLNTSRSQYLITVCCLLRCLESGSEDINLF